MSTIEEGYEEGSVCNREGCQGIIEEKYIDGGCSCHINPPCGYCTTIKEYCPECGWDGEEEQREQDKIYVAKMQPEWDRQNSLRDEKELYLRMQMNGDIPVAKFDYKSYSHTHFSMVKEGVYPDGMTIEEVRQKVDGTFGGRFERFSKNYFKFIAYTD